MAVVYGKSGLVPPSYSMYRNPGVDMESEEFANKQIEDLIDYELNDIQNTIPMPKYGYPRNELEDIKYRDKYIAPRRDVKDPTGSYAQVRDRLDNKNNADAYSAYKSTIGHGMNADDDNVKSRRFQELSAHADELKKRIIELKAEIAWQEKLRVHEMSNDPMWTVAKHKYIYDNDASNLENIMGRKQQDKQLKASQDLQQEQINASKQESKESKDAAARRGRDYLTWTFNNYKANPDDLQALDNLFAAKQKLEELAQDAGKQPEDYYNDTTLEEINMALDEGLKMKQEKVETAKKNAAAAKAIAAEDTAVDNMLANLNSQPMSNAQRARKVMELNKDPQYKDKFKFRDNKKEKKIEKERIKKGR